jgi:hypothetical protein
MLTHADVCLHRPAGELRVLLVFQSSVPKTDTSAAAMNKYSAVGGWAAPAGFFFPPFFFFSF